VTAYLATSPGGLDAVAIIAASTKLDMPFIMALQTARIVLVIAIGPYLARKFAGWSSKAFSSEVASGSREENA